MKKLKSIVVVAGVMLLILSAAVSYISVKNLATIHSADSYEDKGVYTFLPYRVLPVQVKNTGASGRSRRMTPTKTVYMVYYQATDGSGYQWSNQVPNKDMGQKTIDDGKSVARRVLYIPEDNTYITVESEQTAETYTAGLRQKYIVALGVSVGYILLYVLLTWYTMRKKKKSMQE